MRFSAFVLSSSLLMSGAFAAAQTGFTTKIYPAAGDTVLRAADLNHDGKPDLFSYAPNYDGGFIYMNDGFGGFKAPVSLPQGGVPGVILNARVADVNSDGSPDIVACMEQDQGPGPTYFLQLFLNNGSGTFNVGQTTQIAGCANLVVGDVNLDGHQDVVIAYGDSNTNTAPATNTLQTFFGDGTGKFGSPVTVSNLSFDHAATYGDTDCVVNDLTGGNFFLDNHFSLIIASKCLPAANNSPANTGTTFLAHGDGAGHFTTSYSASPNGYNFNSQTVDLNNDGRPDALYLTDTADDYGTFRLSYGINNGGGSFTYTDIATANHYTGAAAADFNGDGFPDVASITSNLAPQFQQSFGPDTISIYNGSQGGTFTQSQSWKIGDANTSPGNYRLGRLQWRRQARPRYPHH